MKKNKLYYVVGLAGSGKTTICKQLAGSVDGGIALQTSGRFMGFIKDEGIDTPKNVDLLGNKLREKLINKLHYTFKNDKSNNRYSFLDGHMYVDNSVTGIRVNAMPEENNGITNGIIFLNTPAKIIVNNVDVDNKSDIRYRHVKSVDAIRTLSENEFQAAESYCIKKNIEFGVLNNFHVSREFSSKSVSDINYLNDYYLPQDKALRRHYNEQFNPNLSPSELRKLHYKIGALLVKPFMTKTNLKPYDYQVISMDRSGNYIANGFIDNFDGPFFTYKESLNVSAVLCNNKPLVIIDSVMDSGNTINNIISKLPNSYAQSIHVICLAINIKALDIIEPLKGRVTFHCLGFSNKEERPIGKGDMGARLYGTNS